MVGLEEAFRCYPSPLQPPLTIIDSKLIRALDFALGVGARGGAGARGCGSEGTSEEDRATVDDGRAEGGWG